jgi:ketosteroid isomerase-like protein
MRRRLLMGCSIGIAMTLLLTTGADLRAQVAAELDAYWAEVSRSVEAGDFEGYSATYHPDAVVIFGMASQPISSALAGWEEGFVDTEAGRNVSSVEFRFSERRNDDTTAHETGIFHYESRSASGEGADQYIHFEALLVKRDGWLMLMEFQQEPATATEWDALR